MEIFVATLTGSALLFSLVIFVMHVNHRKNLADKLNEFSDERSQLRVELTEALNEVVKLKNKPVKDSQELTEFLADFKSHGYSFVRVDPNSVFMRSPREL